MTSKVLHILTWQFLAMFVVMMMPALVAAQSQRRPLPGADHPVEPPPAVEEPAPSVETPDQDDDRVVFGTEHEQQEKKPPAKVRRLYRIGALSLAMGATLPSVVGISLGMDVALFGQEFHNQARTFSLLNATIGTIAAAGMVWPLGLALDGNGSFWATTLSALAAGGAGIGVMYAWAHGDPDRLLAQSFTPGFAAFMTAIVVYEMTSDTSADYREDTGEGDAWISLVPVSDGAAVGIAGTF